MNKARKKSDAEKVRAAQFSRMGRPVLYWKPKSGTNDIRILPAWTDQGPNASQFWREIFIHWGVGAIQDPDPDNTFAIPCCRKTEHAWFFLNLPEGSQPKCKVCEYVDKLKSTRDPADLEMAKNLRAKQRIFSNIIDLTDATWIKDDIKAFKESGVKEEFLPKVGDPKIQVFSYGPTIFNGILDYYQDNIDLTDLDQGRDIKIERIGMDKNTDYRVRPSMNPSKAPIKAKQADSLIYDLDDLMPFYFEEQVKAVLEGATAEEVFSLRDALIGEGKQLAGATKSLKKATKKQDPVEEEAIQEDNEEIEEEVTEEEEYQASEPEESDFPPLDDDGDIDYSQLSDDDIENPVNEKYVVKGGTPEEQTPYIECYGRAKKFNEEDPMCINDCFLVDRCKERMKQVIAEEKAKEEKSAKKKGVGKKRSATPQPKEEPPKKKRPGRPAKSAAPSNGENAISIDPGDEASILKAMEEAFANQ